MTPDDGGGGGGVPGCGGCSEDRSLAQVATLSRGRREAGGGRATRETAGAAVPEPSLKEARCRAGEPG